MEPSTINGASGVPTLNRLTDDLANHHFIEPVKRINDGEDVKFFLASKAYKDIVTWILMLNVSMFPRKNAEGKVTSFPCGRPTAEPSSMVTQLRSLIAELDQLIEQHPPDTGPRRFGNIAFRSWFATLEKNIDDLLKQYTPQKLQNSSTEGISPLVELKAYMLGSWGSAQRLDYGTGHELSFLAFLACLWKLGAFAEAEEGVEERSIVLNVIQP